MEQEYTRVEAPNGAQPTGSFRAQLLEEALDALRAGRGADVPGRSRVDRPRSACHSDFHRGLAAVDGELRQCTCIVAVSAGLQPCDLACCVVQHSAKARTIALEDLLSSHASGHRILALHTFASLAVRGCRMLLALEIRATVSEGLGPIQFSHKVFSFCGCRLRGISIASCFMQFDYISCIYWSTWILLLFFLTYSHVVI